MRKSKKLVRPGTFALIFSVITFMFLAMPLATLAADKPIELKMSVPIKSGIEIVLRNRIRMRVMPDFHEATLGKLIGVLESV